MTKDTASPIDSFIAKLERREPLSSSVRDALIGLPAQFVHVGPSQTVLREGDESFCCLFVSYGFVSRRKRVGERSQIVGVGLQGDAVDLQSLWFGKNDHGILAHTESAFIAIEHRLIIELCERQPTLMKMLWHDSLVDAAVFREWNLNVAHRRAQARLGHFFLELSSRLNAVGLSDGDVFEVPMTQNDLGSALGLSLVHTNKSLRILREGGYVQVRGRTIEILDRQRLVKETGFNPNYLHLEQPPAVQPPVPA